MCSTQFSIALSDSAIDDLDFFRKNERKVISDGIALHLETDANIESRRRKPMRPNSLSTWELRIGDYRVFYDLGEENVVKVVAVGYKVHADLYIQGSKVEL